MTPKQISTLKAALEECGQRRLQEFLDRDLRQQFMGVVADVQGLSSGEEFDQLEVSALARVVVIGILRAQGDRFQGIAR